MTTPNELRIQLTDDDIAANRQGKLSAAQIPLIQSQRLIGLAGSAGLAACVIGIGVLLVLKLRLPAFAARGQLFLAIPLLLFWMWVLSEMPRRRRQANLDLATGDVAAVEGIVQTDIDFGIGLFRTVSRSIRVGDLSFRIPQALQQAFESGRRYRIYYTAHGHQFLGALRLVDEASTPEPPRLVEPLTPRELEVLPLLVAGLTNRQIADQLSLSVNTIKMYTSQLYAKLGVSRRAEAIAHAHELELL